jgi:hypothetical protein
LEVLVSDLGRLPRIRRDGSEQFHNGENGLGFDLLGFWQWSASDVVSNATRGRIAEYIVAQAVGAVDDVRDEWAAYDLIDPQRVTIEVKSAAYIQTWKQDQFSVISFACPKTSAWDPETNREDPMKRRQAQVYVFALLAHQDQATLDPLDVSQWEFYAVPTAVLDRRERSQTSITLNSLRGLTSRVAYPELASAIIEAAGENAKMGVREGRARDQHAYRGSRKHVLEWTARVDFLDELAELVEPAPVEFRMNDPFMPQGESAPAEARLETVGPSWMPESEAWPRLQEWWLAHKAGANTPNWDIAARCLLEGRPGLVLIEAKANVPELNPGGKSLASDASDRSRANHERIGCAIDEARAGWRLLDDGVRIGRDSHYQLANRLAFTWKLATLGIPVVLVYLGFTGDEGIREAGAPFADARDWQQAFGRYVQGTVPLDLFERRLEIAGCPVWLLSRSRPVIEMSPSLR